MPKTRPALLVGLIVLLVGSAPLDASIVVILGERTRILIGTDSRQGNTGRAMDDHACKIRVGARGVFVATGTYPTAVLQKMWAEGERLALSPGEALEHLDGLIKYLESFEFAPTSKYFGAIAFADWTPTGPTVAGAKLTMYQGRFVFSRELRDWRSQKDFGAGYFVLGVDSAVSNADLTNPRQFAQLIDRVITQATADPTVGGPIDMIQVDARGPRWLRQKAECRTR